RGAMPGNLSREALEKLVRGGEIDTVLVAFPDLQGRLMGKRVTGSFFLDQVARGGMHACAYLLTVDVDMTPLPGYRMASWATGYQDFHAVPDWTTLRRIPWLEKTALVLCDLEDEHHQPIEASPRRILRATASPSPPPTTTSSTRTAPRRSRTRRASASPSWRRSTWARRARASTSTRACGTRPGGGTCSTRRASPTARRSSASGWPGRSRARA